MGSMAFLPLSQVLVGGEGWGTAIAPIVLAGAEPLALLNCLPPPHHQRALLVTLGGVSPVLWLEIPLASVQVSGRGELSLLGAYTTLSPCNPRKPVLRRT